MKLSYHWCFALALLWLSAIAVPVNAQDAVRTAMPPANPGTPNATTGTVFRVGCLRYDPDTRVSIELIHRLVDYLRHQERVQAAMRLEGISEIQAQSFDSHRWLMEAMDAEQVDLAFCSLIDYSYQTGGYRLVFQLRLPNDRPKRDQILLRPSVFINNRSRLFHLPEVQLQRELPGYLASHEIALVGPYSASGYVYPLLDLYEQTSGTRVQLRTQFWGSSEEVVKAVINGSAEIGGCDSSVLESVLRASNLWDRASELYREIGTKTKRVPRDPVVLLQRWSPQVSELGRAVRDGTRRFFDELQPPLPQLLPSPDERQFNQLRPDILNFEQFRRAAETDTK